jgi:hypothetical protein
VAGGDPGEGHGRVRTAAQDERLAPVRTNALRGSKPPPP